MTFHRPSRSDHHLSNYWNALVRDAPAEELARLARLVEPSEIAAIEQAHAAHQRYEPDPFFARRLEQTLMNTAITPLAGTLSHPPNYPPTRNGATDRGAVSHRESNVLRPRVGWARRPAFAVAMILLLVLSTIGGIWLATGRPDDRHVITAPLATPATDSTPAGWTHFKGNAARTGETNFGPVSQPVELWSFQAGGPCIPSPAVIGDIVLAACDDGMLHALDTDTGTVRWQFTAEPFVNGPSVGGDLAFVVGGSGTLYAVDIATGAERWRVDAGLSTFSPVAAGDMVIATTVDGGLIVFDAETGSQRWLTQVNEFGALRAPALVDGIAYAGSEAGGLVAVDTTSGEILWRADTGPDATGTATLADGVVYIAHSGGENPAALFAFDAETGDLIWQHDALLYSPSVSGTIGFTGSTEGDVAAIDLATGDEMWRTKVGGEVRPFPVTSDIVYVPSDGDRAIYAYDAATGDLLWSIAVAGGMYEGPAVVDGRIYVTTTFGMVQAFGEGAPDSTMPADDAASPVSASPDATPASEDATPEVVVDASVSLLWQTTGGPESLQGPGSMAFDPDGNLWVVDAANNRFQIFSPEGEFLETWGTPGDGEGQFNFNRSPGDPLNSFGDIAFGADGSFYVAESANRRIQRFDANRQFVTGWGAQGIDDGQFIEPYAIAVAPDGNIYVVDDVRDDVQVFDPDGTYLFTFSSHGTGDGQLNGAGSLAIDAEGVVYIADFVNHRIQTFAADGTFLASIGEFGAGEGQFNLPADVAIDAAGRIVVADLGNGRVQVLDRDGSYLMSWATWADGQDAFAVPITVATDEDGNIYVSDVEAGTVQKFSATLPEAVAGATPMAGDDTRVAFVWQSNGGPEPLRLPTGMAIAPDGAIWVVDAANSRFQIFASDGQYLETWGVAGDGEGEFDFNRTPGDPGNSLGNIAFASDGSFYVADSANKRIQHFSADRAFVTAWGSFGTGDGQFSDPIGVAVGSNGHVYVIDDVRDDIQVFDPAGTYLFTFGGHGSEPGQLKYTGSLAIGPDGTIYVADFSNYRVQQFAANGDFIMTFGEIGLEDGQFVSPAAVAIDKNGYLYVVEPDGGRVQVFTPDGEFVVAWNGADDGQGAFQVPSAVAVDMAGNVYIADLWNGTVQKFAITFPVAAAGAMPMATPEG